MAETVLVTTHDLPLAGKLRAGFRHAGYRVELFTAGEDVAGVDEPALMVFTGGVDTDAGVRQSGQASRLGIPVFAVVGPARAKSPPAAATVAFARPADPEEMVLVGTRTIERRRLRKATGIVGETDAMLEVLERVVQIAPVDATVLVTGESGTGKELVARGIHALSRRRHRSFIPVNVAALSETLLESELFGHEKGAFTGAIDSRKGLFELADGGTIFLDEIGEMPPQTQTKLLRVLEQQEFHRVGGQKLIRVNVRILAATNQRLQHLVMSGDFRKDLYYRLNVLTIALPPLRHRREDIPLLVNTFIRDAGERHDRGPFRGISPDAMDILIRHRWPGNVRELRNLVESMVVLAPGRRIRAEDIPRDVRSGEGTLALVPAFPGGARRGDGTPDSLRPQLEFVFRTMMEMKVDIEDLRREFEAFQAEEHHPGSSAEIVYERLPGDILPVGSDADSPADRDAETSAVAINDSDTDTDAGPALDTGTALDTDKDADTDAGPALDTGTALDTDMDADTDAAAVAYLPGMTLDDMEREVIRTVLESVAWNRRRAAETLGIGERTLYRKVRKYDLRESGEGPS